MVPTSGPNHLADVGRFLVLPDGTLLDVIVELPLQSNRPLTGPSTLVVSRSSDHGATWSIPTTIAEADPKLRTVAGAAVAPDGTVYVSWQRAAENRQSFSLMYAKSTDGGLTWQEKPVGPSIPGPPAAVDHSFAPNLAVTEDGTIGVAFYDHRNDPDNNTDPRSTDFWLRHSHDGGANWADDHIAGHFDQATAPRGGKIGWYQGIAPMSGGFATTFTLAKPLAGAKFELAKLPCDPTQDDCPTNPTDIFFATARISP